MNRRNLARLLTERHRLLAENQRMLSERAAQAPQVPRACFVCEKAVTDDDFCFGCREAICEACDRNGKTMPFGPHLREAHTLWLR